MIRIFIAYSSKDLVLKNEIRKRLGPLKRAGKVEIWDNYDIEAGKDWDVEFREQLAQSDLILLLLSPDALDSDYFYEGEAPIALRRYEAGEAIAVGVLLRPCDLKYTPFGDMTRYEFLPKKGLPITERHWRIFDEAYLTIFQEVDVLVGKIEERRIYNGEAYSCCVLSKGFKFAGSNNLREVAWFMNNSGNKTHSGDEKRANEIGLYDMSGNTWDLCQDTYQENYKGVPTHGGAFMASA